MIEYRCPIGIQGIDLMCRASLVILDTAEIQQGHRYPYATFYAKQMEYLSGSVYINGHFSYEYRYTTAEDFRMERGIKEVYFDGDNVVFVGGGQAPFGVDPNNRIDVAQYTLGVLGL